MVTGSLPWTLLRAGPQARALPTVPVGQAKVGGGIQVGMATLKGTVWDSGAMVALEPAGCGLAGWLTGSSKLAGWVWRTGRLVVCPAG